MESATGAKTPRKSLSFSDLAEHLPDAEGLEGVAWPGAPKVAGTEDIRDRAAWSHKFGDRFWGRGRAVGTERSVAQDVYRVVRVLSESTNSSM